MQIDKIRSILTREWDPIDIGDNPNLFDEYDAYLAGVVKLVNSGSAEAEIAEHLKCIEEQKLGLSMPPERRERAAKTLARPK